MAARLLLLLCVCPVLPWVGAQDAYARLSESYRNGVDLALEQLNSHAGVHHHFRFLRSLEKTEIEVRPRFIQKMMLFGVSSFFLSIIIIISHPKVWVKFRLVLFSLTWKSLASSCCLQGRLPHTVLVFTSASGQMESSSCFMFIAGCRCLFFFYINVL